METYTTTEFQRKTGEMLKAAQCDEVPFMVRWFTDPLCVAAPHRWFKRAVASLEAPPEIYRAPATYKERRSVLRELVVRVRNEGLFVAIPRRAGIACVLVPIEWYEERVAAIGVPEGEKGAVVPSAA
ncbi:type II toxin-antitoxin system Phd/YefM family antitoxin [Streptomyces noursei]|uniref:type II toxin-antitoxin system Phd/YefM family antitoxin n=1 Tax=Streptomyces noursei TaxID=1971 RepID=UPI003450100B